MRTKEVVFEPLLAIFSATRGLLTRYLQPRNSITNTIFSTDELEQDLRVRIKLVGDKLTKVQCPKRVIGGAVPWLHKKIFEGQLLCKALLPLTSNTTSCVGIVRGGAGHVREVAPRGMRRTGREQE